MDDIRLGSTLRLLRIRKHLRQSDVARRAGMTRQLVGRVEAGSAGRYPLDTVRSIANALGARLDMYLRYQGAEIDRVVIAAHGDLHREVGWFIDGLDGWVWLPEVTFSHFGERGVIDILAWHPATRSLLIIELKTELVDPQGLVAVMHRRTRLGRTIAMEQGWDPLVISSWVVVRNSRAERRRLYRHERILRQAFPHDGRTVRRWLGPKATPDNKRPQRWRRLGKGGGSAREAARPLPAAQACRLRPRPAACTHGGSPRLAACARPPALRPRRG